MDMILLSCSSGKIELVVRDINQGSQMTMVCTKKIDFSYLNTLYLVDKLNNVPIMHT